MPPQRLDFAKLKPHDWDTVLAQAWADTKHRGPLTWPNHATRIIHQHIQDRQAAFLAMAMNPLDYGWCRCTSEGQIVVIKPWSAEDYDFDGRGYGCRDLAPPPEEGEAPIPTNFMEWPLSWFDWGFVGSIFQFGLDRGRWNAYQVEEQELWGKQCDCYWPHRWNSFLGDILCQALYDWPPFPNGEAVAAYRTSRMAKPAPAQTTIQPDIAALFAEGAACRTSSSHQKSRRPSPSQTRTSSSASQAAKTANQPSTPSTPATEQLTLSMLFGQTRETSTTTTPTAAG
ncbi:MAG: hypothetical protein U0X20_17140 [Caldilineaceae bacterium]